MIITKAAIMFSNGEIIQGRSYGAINIVAGKLSFRGDRIYGFITSSDDFVLPDKAAEIAIKSKQLNTKVDRLTPEMLWVESD